MNVEDTRLGVAEYIIDKHKLETIELKWGQGAKCIGGEIKVNSLERALELQKRGYIVTPDPSDPVVQAAFKETAIKEFERHSRLGFIGEQEFYAEVDRLRKLGFKRITLKTGAYGLRELAMAIKWGSKAKIDLLTIDGAPGGTGMSPWRMMEEWGMPSLYLHAAAYEFAKKLADKGERVPDIAFAGGFSSEDGVFKALALGAPFVKAVCMGRALMIPGMVGKNIAQWMKDNDLPENRQRVRQHGRRDLRELRRREKAGRGEGDQEHPPGRDRHLQLFEQDQGRPAAVHGRRPVLQYRFDHEKRADVPDRRMHQGHRHTVYHAFLS